MSDPMSRGYVIQLRDEARLAGGEPDSVRASGDVLIFRPEEDPGSSRTSRRLDLTERPLATLIRTSAKRSTAYLSD